MRSIFKRRVCRVDTSHQDSFCSLKHREINFPAALEVLSERIAAVVANLEVSKRPIDPYEKSGRL